MRVVVMRVLRGSHTLFGRNANGKAQMAQTFIVCIDCGHHAIHSTRTEAFLIVALNVMRMHRMEREREIYTQVDSSIRFVYYVPFEHIISPFTFVQMPIIVIICV